MRQQLKSSRNRINEQKLLLRKWTALSPEKEEKNFIVSKVFEKDSANKQYCILEAVLTRTDYRIERHELADAKRWLCGWH